MLKCLLCHKKYRHLGSHIWHGHGQTAREYKEHFELPYNVALITPEIKEKKRNALPTWQKNFKNSKSFQFKKGHSGHRRISQGERKKFVKQMQTVNTNRKPEQCPVCKMIFKGMLSHLFNKHGLLKI